MISCEVSRVAPMCTLFFEASVSLDSDEDLLPGGNIRLAPFAIDVTFIYDFGTALWGFRVRVFTSLVRRDGLRRKSSRTLSWHEDNADEAPQWVRDFVRAHFPPALPALERIGS